AQRRVQRALVQPVNQAQGKEVLAAVGLARAQFHFLDGLPVERVNRYSKDAVTFQRAVLERAGLVTGFVQVAGAESVGIDDQDAVARVPRKPDGHGVNFLSRSFAALLMGIHRWIENCHNNEILRLKSGPGLSNQAPSRSLGTTAGSGGKL